MQLNMLTNAECKWKGQSSSEKNAKMAELALRNQVMFSKAQVRISFIDKVLQIAAPHSKLKCRAPIKIRRLQACLVRQAYTVDVRLRIRLWTMEVLEWEGLRYMDSKCNNKAIIHKWRISSKTQATVMEVVFKIIPASSSLSISFKVTITLCRPWTHFKRHSTQVACSRTLADRCSLHKWTKTSARQTTWELMASCVTQTAILGSREKEWL